MLRKSASLRGVKFLQNSIRLFSSSSIDSIGLQRILLTSQHPICSYQQSTVGRRFYSNSSDEVRTVLYFCYLLLFMICFNRFCCVFICFRRRPPKKINVLGFFSFRTKSVCSHKAARNLHSTTHSETQRGKVYSLFLFYFRHFEIGVHSQHSEILRRRVFRAKYSIIKP